MERLSDEHNESGATASGARRPGRPAPGPGELMQLSVLLTALAVFILIAFQCYQAVIRRAELSAVHASQDAALAAAGKARQQLDALVSGTIGLAHSGNADAQAALKEMERQGVRVTETKKD